MRRAVAILISVLALSGCAALLKPNVTTDVQSVRAGEYRLDPAHASLVFRIDHLGFSKYVGRFEVIEASLDFDASAPETARLEAIVDITSLDVADDDFAATLTGPDWFDAASHPQAVFRSTGIEVTGENTGQVTGDLTLKGVTAPVTLDVVFNGGGQDNLRGAYVTGFSATGIIDRTVFGVDRFAGLVGTEVELAIEAEFLKE